ncbi:MAG: Ldh family oxidoreductase [Chloroflexi bacterium]|nr:Ldh family oxidoreductase [Chloroflexota bacterium]
MPLPATGRPLVRPRTRHHVRGRGLRGRGKRRDRGDLHDRDGRGARQPRRDPGCRRGGLRVHRTLGSRVRDRHAAGRRQPRPTAPGDRAERPRCLQAPRRDAGLPHQQPRVHDEVARRRVPDGHARPGQRLHAQGGGLGPRRRARADGRPARARGRVVPNVDHAELTAYITRIFEALGAPTEDADNVASHLVDANLKGHDSHGVIRAAQYVQRTQEGRIVPGATVEVVQDTPTTAIVDGNWNYGQVVGRETMNLAIEKARDQGVAVATAHRGGHAGRIGAYGEQAAAAGMIAIACVNLHGGGQLVAPFGGGRRRLGTNPIVFAAPTPNPEEPFVLDMATSVGAEGKVRVARNRGVELQPGWILDGDGRPSTDPLDLYGGDPPFSRQAGALLPVGGPVGYKGFGLSMAVEFLAGALMPTTATRPDDEVGGNAIFMLAIDPDHFAGRGPFQDKLWDLIEMVKEPPFQEGFDEVLTAGEPERRRKAQRMVSGIDLEETTWNQLIEAAASAGVGPYEGAMR